MTFRRKRIVAILVALVAIALLWRALIILVAVIATFSAVVLLVGWWQWSRAIRHFRATYGPKGKILLHSARPEALVFRACAGRREFNPLAVVVPPSGPPRVVRFWRAFRDLKHGKSEPLRMAEAELERHLASVALTDSQFGPAGRGDAKVS